MMRRPKPKSFTDWMARVDAHILAYVGLVARDLPDAAWRHWFEAGIDPARAARMAMREAVTKMFG